MMYGWIIGLVLIIVLVLFLNNQGIFQRNSKQTGTGDSAIATLKKRYAEGEIDKAEYEEKKAELEK